MPNSDDESQAHQSLKRLAVALFNVCRDATMWWEAELGRTDPSLQDMKKEFDHEAVHWKREMLRSIEAAENAIPGVDPYVRRFAGTKPGEWTSEINVLLFDLRWMMQGGVNFVVPNERADAFHEKVDDLKEHHRFLHTRDVSVLKEAPEAAKENNSLSPELNETQKSDEHGYVRHPVDCSAYVPASQIAANHSGELRTTLTTKLLASIVEDYSANLIRWTRPISRRTGLPMRNRRHIHLGDWCRYVEGKGGQDRRREGGWLATDPEEIERLKAEIRARKSRM